MLLTHAIRLMPRPAPLVSPAGLRATLFCGLAHSRQPSRYGEGDDHAVTLRERERALPLCACAAAAIALMFYASIAFTAYVTVVAAIALKMAKVAAPYGSRLFYVKRRYARRYDASHAIFAHAAVAARRGKTPPQPPSFVQRVDVAAMSPAARQKQRRQSAPPPPRQRHEPSCPPPPLLPASSWAASSLPHELPHAMKSETCLFYRRRSHIH